MTHFLKAGLTADRFSWSVDLEAVTKAQLFDGPLALITNQKAISPYRTTCTRRGSPTSGGAFESSNATSRSPRFTISCRIASAPKR